MSIPRSDRAIDHITRPLPSSLNIDNRPVYSPPIFSYVSLVGEEYEKKREACLKYTCGDVARTTTILDLSVEWDLLDMYHDWIASNVQEARIEDDDIRAEFFEGLDEEVLRDWGEVREEYWELGIEEVRRADGTWVIYDGKRRGNDEVGEESTAQDALTSDVESLASSEGGGLGEGSEFLLSSDSDEYVDARSALSEDQSEAGEEHKEVKRRRIQ